MYIQAAIEKRSNYRAEIVDPVVEDFDYPEFKEMLKGYPLDLVGISTYTHSLPDVQKTINIVREISKDAVIILGGPHCAMFPEYAIQLEGADAIITGDGEDAFRKLFKNMTPVSQWKELKAYGGKTATEKCSATQSVALPKTSQLILGQIADALSTRLTICPVQNNQWSQQPLLLEVARIPVHSVSLTKSNTESATLTISR